MTILLNNKLDDCYVIQSTTFSKRACALITNQNEDVFQKCSVFRYFIIDTLLQNAILDITHYALLLFESSV